MNQLIYEDIEGTNKGRHFMKLKYGNLELIFMKDNGYINATELCKRYNKYYSLWCKSPFKKSLFNKTSSFLKIPVNDLSIQVSKGKCIEIKGNYIHSIFLTSLLIWIAPQFLNDINDILFSDSNILATLSSFESLSPSKMNKETLNKTEIKKQRMLANELKGFKEVKTPIGNIGILTFNEIIEVKESKKWKDALVQVVSYSYYYPHCQKVIYLFNCDEVNELVLESCKEHDVEVRIC